LLAERSIAVANLEHKACSGSKIQDLDAQIAAVEAFVARQRRPKRPLLVTVSIGGNDAGLTDPKFVLDLLYVMTDDQFEDWLVVLDLLSYDLTERLTRLLQLPDVVVALNEVVNPLNRKSVFFNAPNDDGTMCKDPRNPFAEKRRCWDRFETVINTLNTAYRNQIADLRTRFPGRIVMTERLKDDFSRHWGAPGVEGGQIGLVCNVILGRPVCYPGRVYREECGYQNPVAGAQSTWVQSRTSRDSNSKPFAFTWSWSYFLSLVGRPIMGLPSDWKGDCVHPNDDGQAAIARHLDQAISRLNWNAVRRCGDGPPCAQGETCVAGACITGEEYRIVLTWGAEPRDLDSHLWLPATSPYEVYYSDRGQLDAFPYAELDTDDTTSFGPETITISRLQPGEYTYAVHLFSGTETIGTSGATVRLFRGGTLIGTYTPPPSGPWSEDNGTYVWWHVFTLDSDGTITEVNASSTDPSPYLQSQAFSEDVSTRALPPKTTGSSNDKESGHTGRRDKRTKQTRRRKQRAHR
jgi:lysophospholipase L1-like esterase